MATGFIFDSAGYGHATGVGHPECPERLHAIEEGFRAAGLTPPMVSAREATRAELLRVHEAQHIDRIQKTCAEGLEYPDADTNMVAESWHTALLAAGGAIEACKAVLDGTHTNVFSAMRPPGHHAEADRAMGFCLFNSVAVAARWLQAEAGLKRIAILDWDVHHGNGTQHSTYDDPGIYYISLHQFPHYPGTGRPEERGTDNTNLNLTLPPGAPADQWMDAFHTQAVPELERYAPEFLLISAGFDAHRMDPLGNQNLETAHFVEMTNALKGFAEGKVVSLLEGGYNLHALAECAVAHYRALESG